MATYLYIALGSALGGVARYWCAGVVAARFGETFPWGTLLINILGSGGIGFFATISGPDSRYLVSTDLRLFVMVGLCGGYTTFSAFSLQTLNLLRDGDLVAAGANIALSVFLCLIAAWLGHVVAASLNHLKA